METPPSSPPLILSYRETFPDDNWFEDYDDPTRPWKQHVPVFADISSSPWDKMLEEIIEEHRCRECAAYLCCGEWRQHKDSCWSNELLGTLTPEEVLSIHNYRVDVYNGVMKGFKQWAFEVFNERKHFGGEFVVHRVGFFVRCRECPHCHKVCAVKYHNHEN